MITIILFALGSSFIGTIISNRIFMSINRRLHDCISKGVLQTGITFFEENTQGRILNRFSKDVASLDNLLFIILEMIDHSIKCFVTLVTVIFVSPWLLLVFLFSLAYLWRIRKKCLHVTRDTIRLKFALMSPVNSLIQDAVNGLPTLRCLNQRNYFMKNLYSNTDL